MGAAGAAFPFDSGSHYGVTRDLTAGVHGWPVRFGVDRTGRTRAGIVEAQAAKGRAPHGGPDRAGVAVNEHALQQFTGTAHESTATYTEGAKFVADAGGAYWLDTIAICQIEPRVRAEEFQV